MHNPAQTRDLCSGTKTNDIDRARWERQEIAMTDAQIGLLVATPIIIGFSIALRRMGVLQGYSTAIAVCASCVIAAARFFQQ